MLCLYIANAVHKRPGTLKVQPIQDVSIPPLRTYTFVPQTGQIITGVAKTEESEVSKASKPESTPKKRSAAAMSAESSGAHVPTPEVDDLVEGNEDVEDPADDDGATGTDNEMDDAGSDLAALQKLEEANKAKEPRVGKKATPK